MSKIKTSYTMAEIKACVKNIMYRSQEEYNQKLSVEFKTLIQESAELQFDIAQYESIATKANALQEKHITDRYSRYYFEPSGLKNQLEQKFKEGFSKERNKIKDQFTAIQNRLSSMRNPDTALEFLKACGIELPEKEKPVITIPVDPEFIKSVLPGPKLLSE
jgi:hypothetical protein